MNNTLHNKLKHYVTGAIERGEAKAVVEIPALHKGPFPLHTTKNLRKAGYSVQAVKKRTKAAADAELQAILDDPFLANLA